MNLVRIRFYSFAIRIPNSEWRSNWQWSSNLPFNVFVVQCIFSVCRKYSNSKEDVTLPIDLHTYGVKQTFSIIIISICISTFTNFQRIVVYFGGCVAMHGDAYAYDSFSLSLSSLLFRWLPRMNWPKWNFFDLNFRPIAFSITIIILGF